MIIELLSTDPSSIIMTSSGARDWFNTLARQRSIVLLALYTGITVSYTHLDVYKRQL